MTYQMSDAELDAILGALNDEIQDIAEEAVDVTAGRRQVVREAERLFLAPPPVWEPLPSSCKELTRRAEFSVDTSEERNPFLVFPTCEENSTVDDVLAELDGLQVRLATWAEVVRLIDETRMVKPIAPGNVRWLLAEVRRGLENRTLGRNAALEKIDEVSEEVRPLASRAIGCWYATTATGRQADPRELLNTLARVRRNVDRLYDDGDNLVTC